MSKTKNEGIEYNGPRFCNTVMIKLGPNWN